VGAKFPGAFGVDGARRGDAAYSTWQPISQMTMIGPLGQPIMAFMVVLGFSLIAYHLIPSRPILPGSG
jgi:hypothetical protein